MKKSFSTRIKITGTGKLIRRRMSQDHFKAKRTGGQNRKKRSTVLIASADIKQFRKYL